MCSACEASNEDAATKRCSRCRESKPLTSFNRLAKSPDGHQYNCRACNAAYHAENKARHNAQIHARNRRMRRELQELLRRYLLDHPCVDCGETDLRVLEFDHLRNKTANISQLIDHRGRSWSSILQEIDKCEVVCANCHRRRTYARQGSARHWWVAETLL